MAFVPSVFVPRLFFVWCPGGGAVVMICDCGISWVSSLISQIAIASFALLHHNVFTIYVSMWLLTDKVDETMRTKHIFRFEPAHDKTYKMAIAPNEDSGQPGIGPVWSASLLSEWRKLESLATSWAHSEDSDQTGRMPRLICVFAGRTCYFVGLVRRWLILELHQN